MRVYPEYSIDLFETAPSLGPGVHRVKGETGIYEIFASFNRGDPLMGRLGRELNMEFPVGSSALSGQVSSPAPEECAKDWSRIVETVLALASAKRVSVVAEEPSFLAVVNYISEVVTN